MNTLASHINEALKIGKNLSKFSTYSCQPTSNEELKSIIEYRISKYGPNCDLNDMDVSQIEDMSCMFHNSDFNGDISKWDVSNVTNMKKMFAFSKFDGDISNWDVRNVENMELMFKEAKFDGDISNWKINERCATYDTFFNCPIKEEHKPKQLQR